ncbi:MAG: Uncharacterised protein [Owenweeksia sp. TMED14]|nr:MAG: Uncharacterised protein [Owenweeksia sp. TMED14]|tara:strand:+ start:1561 stop:2031 length:471 start_codon:yes stop_codon:yes gene_type:complete
MIFKNNEWHSLPLDSRIWCFSSDRPWTKDEELYLQKSLNEICSNWKAHGSPIKAGFKTFENRLFALCADESSKEASGCSIDSIMHHLQKVSRKLSLNFFNRMHIYIRENDTIEWEKVSLKKAKSINTGEFLNTVASSKLDWTPVSKIKGSWICPST